EHTYRQAYDLLEAGFGPGFNGPLTIAVDAGAGATLDADDLAAVHAAVASTDGVAFVTPPVVNPAGDTAVLTAFPTTAPQAEATEALVHALRDTVLPSVIDGADVDALVTGNTAGFIDISEKLAGRLPWFIGAVVALSFLLLM